MHWGGVSGFEKGNLPKSSNWMWLAQCTGLKAFVCLTERLDDARGEQPLCAQLKGWMNNDQVSKQQEKDCEAR